MNVLAPALVFDDEEAKAVLDGLDGPWVEGLRLAAGGAPYLARICARRSELAARLAQGGPDVVFAEALAQAKGAGVLAFEDARAALRNAKAATHLACAVGDLTGAWPLLKVTGALTDLADASCDAALALAARELIERGDIIAPLNAKRGPLPGFILLAMGKQGAGELNYSSDIDVTIFYDPELFPIAPRREVKVVAQRVPAIIARVLDEITGDGYVFRTDFRLRPDPASTPIAVSTIAAESYYQSVGQNWERAALIKARPCAGDIRAGQEFLASITPFIWRRHLDYAAIADIHSIKRQIMSTHKGGDLSEPAPNVKLGRGGIRDIELFVQTQQLILGGRDKRLRARDTLGALKALEQVGAIDDATRRTLAESYEFLRGVEHRIQMLNDEQSHRVPAAPDMRARLVALCGFASGEAFDRALQSHRARVAEADEHLFDESESLADPLGSLVFTGVEDDPETLKTLTALGFQQPGKVAAAVRGWHHGRLRATRTERAREILTALMPQLLRAIAASGEPDIAFTHFDRFLAGLPAGVQVLSLFQAQPALLGALADAFGLAPKLSGLLARRPSVLDGALDPHFAEPVADDAVGEREQTLSERMDSASFEDALNIARRYQAEENLRIGMQVLQGRASAAQAGHAHADLAQACVRTLARAALIETERRLGAQPGAFVVLALGKFGGEELAEGSDLDVMVIYEAPEGAQGATDFYTRFTQRLISALSAPTEEGLLYDIDMQLRPSGSAGPVAVRFSSFARYYAEEAWTWELQALTRARVVAGDMALGKKVEAAARESLLRPRDPKTIAHDVLDMRARMDRERPGKGIWDLKLIPGGMVDVEFAAQGLTLIEAAQNQHSGRDAIRSNTAEALGGLAASGALAKDDAKAFQAALQLYADLTQVLRICVEEPFDPAAASGRLKRLLAATAGVDDFDAVTDRLKQVQADIRARFFRVFGNFCPKFKVGATEPGRRPV
jgi:glutamate-ammonia-ligase adenylyltransferase